MNTPKINAEQQKALNEYAHQILLQNQAAKVRKAQLRVFENLVKALENTFNTDFKVAFDDGDLHYEGRLGLKASVGWTLGDLVTSKRTK